MRKYKVEPGMRFSRLVVISETRIEGKAAWLCLCDCGNQKIAQEWRMGRGKIKSCGCLKNQMGVLNWKIRKDYHGGRYTPEWKSWSSMKERCLNPKHKSFPQYGGRGIKICERWVNSFALFLADLGKRPTPKHSLDRIDVNGDYSPDNCRWASPFQQQRNKNDNVIVTAFGETKTGIEWSEDHRCRVKYCTLKWRLRHGWKKEAAILTPPLQYGTWQDKKRMSELKV